MYPFFAYAIFSHDLSTKGGFGGGGGAAYEGGGGGGYSGGGGGMYQSTTIHGAGGAGSSFMSPDAFNASIEAGANPYPRGFVVFEPPCGPGEELDQDSLLCKNIDACLVSQERSEHQR